jgi:hypothetical protein
MNCYDCSRESVDKPAVAVCNVCSAGICRTHLVETDRPVTATRLLNREVELPLRARKLLCHKCSQALQQGSKVQQLGFAKVSNS